MEAASGRDRTSVCQGPDTGSPARAACCCLCHGQATASEGHPPAGAEARLRPANLQSSRLGWGCRGEQSCPLAAHTGRLPAALWRHRAPPRGPGTHPLGKDAQRRSRHDCKPKRKGHRTGQWVARRAGWGQGRSEAALPALRFPPRAGVGGQRCGSLAVRAHVRLVRF